jgi:hypothetical protein
MRMRPQLSQRMLDDSAYSASQEPQTLSSLDSSGVVHVVDLFSPLAL